MLAAADRGKVLATASPSTPPYRLAASRILLSVHRVSWSLPWSSVRPRKSRVLARVLRKLDIPTLLLLLPGWVTIGYCNVAVVPFVF